MSKKHCNFCNKDLSYAGWSRHIKSKTHIKKVNKQELIENENKKEILKEIMINEQNNEILKLKEELLKCKEQLINEKEKNIKLEKEILKLNNTKTINNNTTNNNDNRTINNNITINVIGQENVKGIMNQLLYENIYKASIGDDYNQIEPKPKNAIELYLNNVYNKPENQNIKYTNLQSNNCKIFEDNKWITKDIDNHMVKRIKNCSIKLEEMLKEFKNDKNIIHDNDIKLIIQKIDEVSYDLDNEIIKKTFYEIIKKQKRICYDNTKK